MFEYLACPCTHDDRRVETLRRIIATNTGARLVMEGRNIYSPITMSHPMDVMQRGRIPHHRWLEVDKQIFRHAGRLVIIELEGWQQSVGINNELKWARELDIPIEMLDPVPYNKDDYLAVHRSLLKGNGEHPVMNYSTLVSALDDLDKQLSSW